MLEVTPELVRARLVPGPHHQQPYGILHGGVYCSIVEGVASYGAGFAARAGGQLGVVGVSNTTDFLRPHSAGELLAEGTPVHVGRRAPALVRARSAAASTGSWWPGARCASTCSTSCRAERRLRAVGACASPPGT